MTHPILHAKDIHKSFYNPAPISILKGVTLRIEKGQAVAITGRSGEGKSTLLQLLGTLDAPCSGSLEIASRCVNRFNKDAIRNQHLAFVFQNFHLLEDYTALENVMMPARIGRKNVSPSGTLYKRCCDLLEHVGLADRKHFHTKLLSGGEKQRVCIARALCNNPDLILADEPSGNLDAQNAAVIHRLLLDFAHKENRSVLIVTHDQHLAGLCDAHYVLHDGVLQEARKK